MNIKTSLFIPFFLFISSIAFGENVDVANVKKNLNKIIAEKNKQIHDLSSRIDQTQTNFSPKLNLYQAYENLENLKLQLKEIEILFIQSKTLYKVKSCIIIKELARFIEEELVHTSKYQLTDKDMTCQCFDNASEYLATAMTKNDMKLTQQEQELALADIQTIREKLVK